ncbi:MAG TPA: hypothetical protein VFK21_11055 [Gammaproteobacteria bacterium]|nr:hypothetical protein [Gammaproteobacteria bacterium]
METKQAVHTMVRAYAAILFILGCLFTVLALVAFILAIGPFSNYARWVYAFTYQLAIWGIIQIISGSFLFLIRHRLAAFIDKETQG